MACAQAGTEHRLVSTRLPSRLAPSPLLLNWSRESRVSTNQARRGGTRAAPSSAGLSVQPTFGEKAGKDQQDKTSSPWRVGIGASRAYEVDPHHDDIWVVFSSGPFSGMSSRLLPALQPGQEGERGLGKPAGPAPCLQEALPLRAPQAGRPRGVPTPGWAPPQAVGTAWVVLTSNQK